jgi:uracil-DNA glycosylase
LGNEWDELLGDEFTKPYYLTLRETLKREYGSFEVYPDMHDIFNALKYTSYGGVRAVILGQDPYHGRGQAHGLAFSVRDGVPKPPSLENIFKELRSDLGCGIPDGGCLTKWAHGGVLLLNSVLTVRAGVAASHRDIGWEVFTDRVIQLLSAREKPIVFLLWGADARKKARLITSPAHKLLQSAHPSPLSAYNGFFGCRHFSQANEFLTASGQAPIDWNLCGEPPTQWSGQSACPLHS